MNDVEKVAKVLKVNPQTVRLGLQQGCYPFGTAVKCAKGYSYQFFAKKVEEYIGINIKDGNKDGQRIMETDC